MVMNDLVRIADIGYAHVLENCKTINKRRPACRAGCAHCCFIAVSATYAEARAIVAGGDAGADDGPALQFLSRRPRPSAKEYSRALIRCQFLRDDNMCEVYERRPFMCRGFFAFDATKCADPTLPLHLIADTKPITFKIQSELISLTDIALIGPLPVMVHIARTEKNKGTKAAREAAKHWGVDTYRNIKKQWAGW